MSDEYSNLDPNDPDLVKKLRGIIDLKDKSIKELSTKVESFEVKERTTTLASKIEARGLNPKIAALALATGLKDDDLDNWLTEYADVFGGPTPVQGDPNAADAAEAARMAAVQQGAILGNPGDLLTRINSANNWDELNAALKSV